MGTMLDNCIVKNGFKTRMMVLLYLLLNISNMSMYKCMPKKTNESLRRDKYPVYGERLSSIEDTDLHGALKMREPGITEFNILRSDRSAAISDAENNNDNTITMSTRCTTDEPIKLGGYVPASDSEEEEKDKIEIKKTVKVPGLHNEPNEIGKEIDEDPGQDDEVKPHKECSKEDKGKEAGNYSKYSNYMEEDKEKRKTKNETEEEYKDGEELEKEDEEKDKDEKEIKDEGEGNTKNETEEEYNDGEDLEKENEEKGKDKDEKAKKDKNKKEGRDKDEKDGEAKDKKESEGKDDKEGEYKDEEEIGEEDEEKGKDKDEKERRDKNEKEGKDRVKKEEKDKDKKAGNDDNWEEDKGWEPYADKESDEGFEDWSEDEEFKEWEERNKGFPQIPLSLELTNTRVTKKYASPEPRDAPDHYIDDI